jgi:hypothetical protein
MREYYKAGFKRLVPLHAVVNGSCTCGTPDCDKLGFHPYDNGYMSQPERSEGSANFMIDRGKLSNGAIITDTLAAIESDEIPDDCEHALKAPDGRYLLFYRKAKGNLQLLPTSYTVGYSVAKGCISDVKKEIIPLDESEPTVIYEGTDPFFVLVPCMQGLEQLKKSENFHSSFIHCPRHLMQDEAKRISEKYPHHAVVIVDPPDAFKKDWPKGTLLYDQDLGIAKVL